MTFRGATQNVHPDAVSINNNNDDGLPLVVIIQFPKIINLQPSFHATFQLLHPEWSGRHVHHSSSPSRCTFTAARYCCHRVRFFFILLALSLVSFINFSSSSASPLYTLSATIQFTTVHHLTRPELTPRGYGTIWGSK